MAMPNADGATGHGRDGAVEDVLDRLTKPGVPQAQGAAPAGRPALTSHDGVLMAGRPAAASAALIGGPALLLSAF
ncbi:hypothetical protein [Roseivivax isoporae]|uniref:Uncharacterized protein n=1 Tax=Roseivivax isoporae LMG 25204 TaxID=1449351 RepID=X7FDD2_9RHOB|nr:hypothetical protein [Roseivivax isoporae]ETX30034.1 hypothetical protein RISW2_20455 [Roseivivax isoporae LMG 25204]